MQSEMSNRSRIVPVNFGPLRGANAHAQITGPCGDTMAFWLAINAGEHIDAASFTTDSRISMATFTTDGCLHSMSCASAAAELAVDKTLQEALEISPDMILDRAGNVPDDSTHCALLATKTLHLAIREYLKTLKPEGCNQDRLHCEDCTQSGCAHKAKTASKTEPVIEDSAAAAGHMRQVAHKLIVMSGKGGVGKSTVAVNLARSLAAQGLAVGLLDVDIHGPSIPTMLGIVGQGVESDGEALLPLEVDNLKVISIGLLLNDPDDAIIWRGPRKMGLIKQFIEDVAWGALDYLIVDCPPGTGDEPLSVCQMIPAPDGAILVTTPQEVALADVRKSMDFCRQLNLPVVGLVENFSGFVCPQCHETTAIFDQGGGERLAGDQGINFLGRIPIEVGIRSAADQGLIVVDQQNPGCMAIRSITQQVLELTTSFSSLKHGGSI